MGLRETLEAATRDPDYVLTDEKAAAIARLNRLAPELAAEVLELRERHREAMALALDWGNWTRDFLLGDNIDPGDRADLTALLARLDQIGAADETRLGKEQT